MTRRKRSQATRQPDMTPMIDVTFLLLVFFIVTLNIRQLEGRLDAALPKDRGVNLNQVEQVEKVDIRVTVAEPGQLVPENADGDLLVYQGRRLRYEVGTQTFANLPALEAFLATFPRDTPVSLNLRKGTTQGDAIGLLDRAIALDFQEISFAASEENE